MNSHLGSVVVAPLVAQEGTAGSNCNHVNVASENSINLKSNFNRLKLFGSYQRKESKPVLVVLAPIPEPSFLLKKRNHSQ